VTTTSSPQAAVPVPLAGIVLLLGVAGGVLTEVLQGVLDYPWAAWADSIAVWAALAFPVGAIAGTSGAAAVAGVATEALLVVSFYAAQAAEGFPVAEGAVAFWLLAAVPGGIVFGVAGAWWRRADLWHQAAGTALVGGVFVVEGLVRWRQFVWQHNAGALMVAAGLVAPLVLGRSWHARLLGLAGVVIVLPLGAAGWQLTDAVLAR
jgi:hypothetical protein